MRLSRPERFGLSTLGRRQIPGIRREEVARLAGVGISWYTWLEQGRAITVSDQVIERLAETFQHTVTKLETVGKLSVYTH